LWQVNTAFQLLLGAHPPHMARLIFQDGLLTNKVRLLCDGEVVPPAAMVAFNVRLLAEAEPDGRSRCEVIHDVPQRVIIERVEFDEEGQRWAVIQHPPQPVWEVPVNEVKALLPQEMLPEPRPEPEEPEQAALASPQALQAAPAPRQARQATLLELADRALYPEMRQLMQSGLTHYQAATQLVDRIKGPNTKAESRIDRLARRFYKENREFIKSLRTCS
jgi:hypothetical protein